ncbi:type-2 angiotensin II receptor [Hydra vulgaris]|uniref:type-2 angiotensin II receptor n=1 Tax=Hydra vulgaris TaxID=6087 RepID=UPI001F5EB917|nr:type-2 angiotensin II receptor-like [Hydra vulgaris]
MLFNTSKQINEEAYNSVEILIVTLFSLIFVFGTVGNVFVFFYFGIKEKPARSIEQRKVPEFLFCVLAIVDFFASVFNPLLYAYWTLTRHKWHFGYWACKLVVPIGTIATTMSGGIFVVLSFDRQRTIVYPFKRHFKFAYIKLSILLVLVYAVVINAHYSLNITLKNKHCAPPNAANKAYNIPSIFYFLINVCTLLVVINFTNYRIFLKMLHQSPTSTLVLGNGYGRRKKDNYRIVRLLVALSTVFFVLTLPRDILQFVFLSSWCFGKGLVVSKPILTLNSFLKVFNVANSCVNPLIYYKMHYGFKRFIRRSFGCQTDSLIRGRSSNFNVTERLADLSFSQRL